jgi:hypothetical protein
MVKIIIVLSCIVLCNVEFYCAALHCVIMYCIESDPLSLLFFQSPSTIISLSWVCIIPSTLFLFAHVQVRSYMYESVSLAVRRVINEKDTEKLKSENIVKSRMQIKVNFPEVNPAFDTYRIGTVLEMVRTFVLYCVLYGTNSLIVPSCLVFYRKSILSPPLLSLSFSLYLWHLENSSSNKMNE